MYQRPIFLPNWQEKRSNLPYCHLPIEKLKPFEGHPFYVKDDEEMEQLTESIRQQCGYPFPNIIAFKTANKNKNTRYSEEYLVFILCLLNTIDAIMIAVIYYVHPSTSIRMRPDAHGFSCGLFF